MAEDDIYGSKHKYEQFKNRLDQLLVPPDPSDSRRRYYCKNPDNLRHFHRAFAHFEARDISFVRRTRLLLTLRVACHLTSKNLIDCTREDIDAMVAAMHGIYHSPKSKQTFLFDLKHLWKLLFPEMDSKGRPDDNVVPYTVRHLSAKVDRSRQKLRQDKLLWSEFERLVGFFSADPRMQCYLTLALECLAARGKSLQEKQCDAAWVATSV